MSAARVLEEMMLYIGVWFLLLEGQQRKGKWAGEFPGLVLRRQGSGGNVAVQTLQPISRVPSGHKSVRARGRCDPRVLVPVSGPASQINK